MLLSLQNLCYVLVVRTVERVSVSAFVDPADHERLVKRARSEDRSVSAELRVAIREHLERQAVDRYLYRDKGDTA